MEGGTRNTLVTQTIDEISKRNKYKERLTYLLRGWAQRPIPYPHRFTLSVESDVVAKWW
jgi:hypothetical protein